jgi:hypothetical protein
VISIFVDESLRFQVIIQPEIPRISLFGGDFIAYRNLRTHPNSSKMNMHAWKIRIVSSMIGIYFWVSDQKYAMMPPVVVIEGL